MSSRARPRPTIRGRRHGAAVDQGHAPAPLQAAEPGALAAHTEVAPRGQLQAAGHAPALDGGDDRLGELQAGRAEGPARPQRRQVAEVGTGAEGARRRRTAPRPWPRRRRRRRANSSWRRWAVAALIALRTWPWSMRTIWTALMPTTLGSLAVTSRLRSPSCGWWPGRARGRKLVAPSGAATRPTSDRTREALVQQPAQHGRGHGGDGARPVRRLRSARHRGAVPGREPLHVRRGRRAGRRGDPGEPGHHGVRRRRRGRRRRRVRLPARPPGRRRPVPGRPSVRLRRWPEMLAAVDAAVLAIESDRPIELPAPFDDVRSRRYGGTVVTLGRRSGA